MNAKVRIVLSTVDSAMLTPFVSAALRRKALEVESWRCETVAGGAGGGVSASEVYRFQGQARDRAGSVSWRIVLKVLHAGPDANRSGIDYWRREVDAYQSGMFARLPNGLAAPRCFGIMEFPGEACWLWLEDLPDPIPKWPIERYGLAARHIGRLSGKYLTKRALPKWPWLGSAFIRQDLAHFASQSERLAMNLRHPLLRRFLPGNSGRKLLDLWAERDRLFTALEELPPTICHFDAFRRNLFARRVGGRDQTVLIDWAFVGRGPIGADIVSMVWVSLAMLEVKSSQAKTLGALVFKGYVDGLRDAGWKGDAELARLGFTAAIGLRRLGTFGHMLPWILDESQHAHFVEVARHSIIETADQFGRTGAYVEKLTDEARELLKSR